MYARIYSELAKGRAAVMDETTAVVTRKDDALSAAPAGIADDVGVLVSAAEEVLGGANVAAYDGPEVRQAYDRVQAFRG